MRKTYHTGRIAVGWVALIGDHHCVTDMLVHKVYPEVFLDRRLALAPLYHAHDSLDRSWKLDAVNYGCRG